MRKTLLCLSSSIEFDQVKCNLLNLGLCFFLQPVPYITTQLIHFGNSTLLAGVLSNFMQAANVHIEDIRILIHQTYRLLHTTVYFNFLEPTENTNSMINMRNKISGL